MRKTFAISLSDFFFTIRNGEPPIDVSFHSRASRSEIPEAENVLFFSERQVIIFFLICPAFTLTTFRLHAQLCAQMIRGLQNRYFHPLHFASQADDGVVCLFSATSTSKSSIKAFERSNDDDIEAS